MVQYINKVAQLALRGSFSGQQVENIFYILNDNGWSDSDLLAVVDAAATVWTSATGVLHYQASNVIFTGAVIRDLSSATGKTFASTIGIGTAGGSSSTGLPNNVAWALHKNAVVGGRHAKGRTYHYGIVAGQLDTPNTIAAAAATLIRNAYQALQDGIQQSPAMHMGFVAWRQGGVPLTTPVFIPQTGFGWRDLTLDSQRRRLPGRGR